MENKLRIGCHLSSSDGFMAMGNDAKSIDATTFAFFTRNPRGGTAKPIDKEDIKLFLDFAEKNDISKLVAHAPYTLNPCSANPDLRVYALETMKDDIYRMSFVPNNYYNFHPGSHTGQGIDIGISQTIELLNNVLTEDMTTTVLIETMAGKGSEIGSKFEEVRRIIDGVNLKEKIGVCMDTCHIWEAGYDIINNLDGVIDEFDSVIGLNYLKAIHLNDSKNPIEAHKDRHEKIGQGHIGLETLVNVINHKSLKHLPFILETPNELDGYKEEIKLLRNKYIKD